MHRFTAGREPPGVMNETLQPNRRAVPQDLTARRFDDTYIVASTSDEARVREAARALEAAGFSADEIIVVSDEIDTVRLSGDELVETASPIRLTRGSGRVAGGFTGAAFGALIGLTVAFIGPASVGGYAPAVLVGGVVGAIVGVIGGQWMASRLARRPAHVFEDLQREGSMIVGVGFNAEADDERRLRAASVLEGVDLTPRCLECETVPAA